jgi:hypothetical protein
MEITELEKEIEEIRREFNIPRSYNINTANYATSPENISVKLESKTD